MLEESETYDRVHDSKNVESSRNPLTNADFRKLIQSSRTTTNNADHETKNEESRGSHSFTHRSSRTDSSVIHHKRTSTNDRKTDVETAAAATGPRIRTEEDELNDILKKYRDRAKERREGEVRESEQELDLIKAGGYRAVAPDIRINLNLAEKRKKIIEESKYLGGDMEHTHLVKGLDYALLQKVRSEILSKEKESDDLEKIYQAKKHERNQVENEIKSNLARNIYNTLFKKGGVDLEQKEKIVNELFAPRRMAYVIEMDDEYSDDVPTVLIRSKQDCPVDETSTNLSINDVVIQKLTQVLSYLRADNKKKKKGKDKITDEERTKAAGQNIYDDVGEYVPNLTKNQQQSSSRKQEYFPKIEKQPPPAKIPEKQAPIVPEQKKPKPVAKKDQMMDSYAECYPGGMECYDAAGDSDDDADFSKMDLGNKKGPIRRWDFDTEQEYEDWMSNREALPKAAFQYGVKMLDGRKTRKLPGPRSEKDEKAKIDRQWAKISKILEKRKQDGDSDTIEPKKNKI